MAVSAHTAAKQCSPKLHGQWITAWVGGRLNGTINETGRKDEDHLVSAIQSPVSEGSNLCVPSTCLKAAMSRPASERMFMARPSLQSLPAILCEVVQPLS